MYGTRARMRAATPIPRISFANRNTKKGDAEASPVADRMLWEGYSRPCDVAQRIWKEGAAAPEFAYRLFGDKLRDGGVLRQGLADELAVHE